MDSSECDFVRLLGWFRNPGANAREEFHMTRADFSWRILKF
jgi:hypothetical protein